MDHWKGEWVIISGADSGPKAGGGAVIYKPGASNKFKLVPVKRSGKVDHYVVDCDPADMTEYWEGCGFYPEGSVQIPAVAEGDRIDYPQDTAKSKSQCDKLVRDVESDMANIHTARLKGTISVNGNEEHLYLYRVPKAIVGAKDFLSVSLDDPTVAKKYLVGNEDGTGHGHRP